MKYYPDADILVIELREGRVADEELLDSDVVLGYDEKGLLVRVEVHDASKRGLVNVIKEFATMRREVAAHILKTVLPQNA